MAGYPVNIGAGGAMQAALNSYVFLDTQITSFEANQLRKQVAGKLLSISRDRGIGSNAAGLTVRDILPTTDLALGANEVWITGVLAAGWNNYINSALANNRCAAFYGIACQDAAVIVDRVQFQSAGGGSTYADVDIFGLYLTRNTICYLVNPIFYGPTDTVLIRVSARAAGTSRIQAIGLIVEPQGIRVSQNALAL